jgi:signal peptidase I
VTTRGVVGVAALGCAAVGVVLAVARRRWIVVTVRGRSMAPTVEDGDRLLVRRVRGTAVRPGQIVVVEHPDAGDGSYRAAPAADPADRRVWMVKRCTAVAGDPVPAGLPARCATGDGRVPPRTFTVLSDNPGYRNDSRRFGFITCDRVLGVVARPGR